MPMPSDRVLRMNVVLSEEVETAGKGGVRHTKAVADRFLNVSLKRGDIHRVFNPYFVVQNDLDCVEKKLHCDLAWYPR